MIRYQEFPPCEPLAPFVHAFWRISSTGRLPEPIPVRVVPDGCVDLIFDGGRLSVVGPMTAPKVVWMDGLRSSIAVRFLPGGAHPFLRLPLHELADRAALLSEIQRGGDAMSAAGGLNALESVLLRRLPSFRPDSIDQALAIIAKTGGRAAVGALTSEVGLSARHLERKFLERVGLGPKTLSRIVRFQHAIAALAGASEVDWLDLVEAGSFSDQAHFIRDFRALSGLTPGAYRREQERVGFVQYSTAGGALASGA